MLQAAERAQYISALTVPAAFCFGKVWQRMNTPICDFVQKYIDSVGVRFHMPGHKGESVFTGQAESHEGAENIASAGQAGHRKSTGNIIFAGRAGRRKSAGKITFAGRAGRRKGAENIASASSTGSAGQRKNKWPEIEKYDITEIDGADVLYKASGIIKESEENASRLFGTARTKYSTEGSSLSIRAMLYLTVLYAKERGCKPLILAGRNAHQAFLSAVALLDLEVEWLYPKEQESLMSCKITDEQLAERLADMPQKPVAVYITSPDYLGNISDIEGLAAVCHSQDVLLLVDNAHGAYLQFLKESRHPIALGADMCCDSAHKTLPVLTGGGYLHIAPNAPELFAKQVERAMNLFASTSPSYLILQSLDAANQYLAEGYREKLAECATYVEGMKKRLQDAGYTLVGDEPLKLTIATKDYGWRGNIVTQFLAIADMIGEFADQDFVVLMLTPELRFSILESMEAILRAVPRRPPITEKAPTLSKAERVCSVREAMFANSEERNVRDCLGQVLASASVSCPPAIPIVVCGERIDEQALQCFAYYGVERCNVIAER